MSSEVVVVEHPVVQHKLTFLRMKETSTRLFRDLLGEIGMLLAYEVTRDLPLERRAIETPLGRAESFVLGGKKVVLVSILRAGQGLLDGMLRVLPSARVGHIGLYRDHDTLEAIQYYAKLPGEMSDRLAIVIDPMLATGHSAIAAVRRVKETRPKAIKFVCLVAAPEGLDAFRAEHPDVPVYTAAIDERLNDQGYIVPGLGDAGDRIFGTR